MTRITDNKLFGVKVGIIIYTIMIGVLSWAFYQTLNQAVKDVLKLFGITNVYAQNLTVIFVGVALLVLFGFAFNKVVKKIIGVKR